MNDLLQQNTDIGLTVAARMLHARMILEKVELNYPMAFM